MSSSAPIGAREAQRAEVAQVISAGRRAAVIGPHGGEGARAVPEATVVTPDEFLRDGAPDATALIALDPIPARLLLAVARAVAERAEKDVAAVLSVGAGHESLVAPALSNARTMRQIAVEAVWVGAQPPQRIDVAVPDAAAATIRVLLILGGPESMGGTRLATTAITAPHHAVLEREVAELRSANARALGARRPIESAAAAALLARSAALEQRLVSMDEKLVGMQHRLAREVEVARVNDELFQEAREIVYAQQATLSRPHHRAVAGAARRVSRVPLLGKVLRRILASRGH